MLLALITSQRLDDICKMQFFDIWDDMLHAQQEKTGSQFAIPLDLKCEVLNMTLREVISTCRDAVVRKNLAHFHHSTSQSVRGGSISSSSLFITFKKAREKVRY